MDYLSLAILRQRLEDLQAIIATDAQRLHRQAIKPLRSLCFLISSVLNKGRCYMSSLAANSTSFAPRTASGMMSSARSPLASPSKAGLM